MIFSVLLGSSRDVVEFKKLGNHIGKVEMSTKILKLSKFSANFNLSKAPSIICPISLADAQTKIAAKTQTENKSNFEKL